LVKNSLGANHVLLRGGQVLPIDENDDFVNGPHPRTLFGWDGHGQVARVTIGSAVPGRQAGVSLPVAAQLMKNLGLRGAVNLDGGGSSTFVDHGRVFNHPSDGRARSVTNAWLVFPRARPRPHKPAG
jgi:exopolysaccharide biosynthesis protein